MSEATRLLNAMGQGDPRAASELLPLLYDELRSLARAHMARERDGHTLQATALVHEAYARLVEGDPDQQWDGRRHFFAAAAEAMRRILIEHARAKNAAKRGGAAAGKRVELDDANLPAIASPCDDINDLLALNDALDRMVQRHPERAELVKLLYFGGLNLDEAAAALGISRSTAYRQMIFARAWLYDAMKSETNGA